MLIDRIDSDFCRFNLVAGFPLCYVCIVKTDRSPLNQLNAMYTVYIEGHGYHNSFERETLEEAKALADRLADKYACASVDIVVYDQDGNEVYTIE